MAITEADVINAIQDFTYLSVQTSAEATALTNTSANLLYNSRSRRQGNFTSFYAMAALQVARDESSYGISLTDTYKLMAYAYVIQYYYERKFKDYNATHISSGGDSVSRPGNGISPALQSYREVFDTFKTVDSTIVRHTDYEHYPTDWKNTQMVIDDIEIKT
jgi:hypothetical protein